LFPGNLPSSFNKNPGSVYLLDYLSKKGLEIPKGLDARSVLRRHNEMFNTYREKISTNLATVRNQLHNDPDGTLEGSYPIRDLTVAHDIWSARFNGGSHGGIGISYTQTNDEKWVLKNPIIGLAPLKHIDAICDETSGIIIDKSAKATTELYLKELQRYKIHPGSLLASTSDTTKSALNVFKDNSETKEVLRILCLSHTKQLFLKHSLMGEYVPTTASGTNNKFQKYIDGGKCEEYFYCDALMETLLAINEVCKKVGGSESLRLKLENALKAAKKKVLQPRKHFEVRWNSFETVVER